MVRASNGVTLRVQPLYSYAAENGIVDLDAYGPEWRGLALTAAAICIGDVSIVKGLLRIPHCKAARDEYTAEVQ